MFLFLDCRCNSLAISTYLNDQSGEYIKCEESDCSGKSIYRHQTGNKISTLIQDSAKEWKVISLKFLFSI